MVGFFSLLLGLFQGEKRCMFHTLSWASVLWSYGQRAPAQEANTTECPRHKNKQGKRRKEKRDVLALVELEILSKNQLDGPVGWWGP